jgi:hypothetical protein
MAILLSMILNLKLWLYGNLAAILIRLAVFFQAKFVKAGTKKFPGLLQ